MKHPLTAETVFDRYERIRHRLVEARFPKASAYINGLANIADDIDAVIFDSFGVLNVGDRPIQGAVACVNHFRALGKRLIVLTNAASYPVQEALHKYAALGYDFIAPEVISSRAIAVQRLAAAKGTWASLCAPDDALSDFGGRAGHWDSAAASDPAGYLLLSGAALTKDAVYRLETALRQKPAPLLVANPDLVAPRETGLSLEPGWIAHDLIDQLGVSVDFFGKPYSNAFDEALARLPGIPRHRIAMVGDTLHTDILGGAAAGLRTVLVTDHGIMAGRDVAPFIHRSGIVPDFIAPSI